MGHDLGAALAAGPDDRRRLPDRDELRERLADGLGGMVGESRILDRVQDGRPPPPRRPPAPRPRSGPP